MRVYAPRILNEPVRWRFSHFSHTGPPQQPERSRGPAIGVRATTPARSARAACTSASPTGWAVAVTTASSQHPRRSSQALFRYGG